jgi:hypothetical protein
MIGIDRTPNITGTLFIGRSDAESVCHYFESDRATGDEYGGALSAYLTAHAAQWGLAILVGNPPWVRQGQPVPRAADTTALELQEAAEPGVARQRRAMEVARSRPSVPVEAPETPALSGDLLDDVRALSGLTYAELGAGFGISERAVASWRGGRIPRHRLPALQALRSIGLSLIGGLGARGVHDWLLRGSPQRLLIVLRGDVAPVAADARAYESSLAT